MQLDDLIPVLHQSDCCIPNSESVKNKHIISLSTTDELLQAAGQSYSNSHGYVTKTKMPHFDIDSAF